MAFSDLSFIFLGDSIISIIIRTKVDEFLGDNVGLTVAEIELLSQNEVFLKPRWIGKEVSHNLKYSNYQNPWLRQNASKLGSHLKTT